jgi:DNA invertase Pin-like site-specific DNA recombinase
LLIESFDRLSRNDVPTALTLFLNIIRAGITIVTLADEREYSWDSVKNDFTDLIISLTIMSRAHEESKVKSKRVKASWDARVKRASSTKQVLTSLCPSWLTPNADRTGFYLVPERVKAVKTIFRLAKNGIGAMAISTRLNADNVPNVGPNKTWNRGTINGILKSRSVLGEYQPKRMEGNKRIPEGDPIADYFPKVISEADFNAVQEGLRKRTTKGKGNKGKKFTNLFTGFIKCPYCGGTVRYFKGGRSKEGSLVCSNGLNNRGCTKTRWNYPDFERRVLKDLVGLDIRSLIDTSAQSEAETLNDQIVLKRAELETITGKIDRIIESIEEIGVSKSLKARLLALELKMESCEDNLKQLTNELEVKRRSLVNADDQIMSIEALMRKMDCLNKEEGAESELYDLRSKLSGLVHDLVSTIFLYVEGDTEYGAPYRFYMTGSESAYRLIKADAEELGTIMVEKVRMPRGWGFGRRATF